MPVTELMMDGVHLMLLGMGTVFTFLVILVAAIVAMSRLASKLSTETRSGMPASVPPQPVGTEDDGELIAVISAAISRFRSTHK